MFDIRLDNDGDIYLNDNGEMETTESVRQAILVRLRWIYDEWRLGPELGFKWYEYVWVKNPNLSRIKSLVRSEIMSVDEVVSASVTDVDYDQKTRRITITYTAATDQETFEDEVTLYGY